LAHKGLNPFRLYQIVGRGEAGISAQKLRSWSKGYTWPRTEAEFKFIEKAEKRLKLPNGTFEKTLGPENGTPLEHALLGFHRAHWQVVHWHVPADFNSRSPAERAHILDWIRINALGYGGAYSNYRKSNIEQPFGFYFPSVAAQPAYVSSGKPLEQQRHSQRPAPAGLDAEMKELVAYKTATICPIGFQRSTTWLPETVSAQARVMGIFFGCLSLPAKSLNRCLSIPAKGLTFALLAFPALLHHYLNWRQTRRGFFTASEILVIGTTQCLLRPKAGWLRQHPELSKNLIPVPGLISRQDIAEAKKDWGKQCDSAHDFAMQASKQVRTFRRVHRDPYAPIAVVLAHKSPVTRYKLIVDELLKRWPRKGSAEEQAEHARSHLLLRIALHSGLRSRNLRELLFRARGENPRHDAELERRRRGELRWNPGERCWEIFIPCVAFKNYRSSFFASSPYRLRLPNLSSLWSAIDEYLSKHRPVLIGSFKDTGALFVRRTTSDDKTPEYGVNTFHSMWRVMIQRYGIYNPFTRRGAIAGLLPHGPHCVRDVLATHILKKTGSYELASYAIQDTTQVLIDHYSRFFPHDKTMQAANILKDAWRR
jgi:hypothetical protein